MEAGKVLKGTSLMVGLFMLTSCATPMQSRTDQESLLKAKIDTALSWLPEDTETVIVAARPGRIHVSPKRDTVAEAAMLLAAIGMPSIESDDEWDLSYEFIVNGTRNYRAPRELGLMPYDGCKIVGLNPSEFTRLESLAKRKAAWTGAVSGHNAYVLRAKLEQDTWTWFLTFEDGLLFCATNKAYFAELLKRRSGVPAGRALPETLEEWKYIDKNSPLWAIRHFTPAMNKFGGGVNMDDDKLVGYGISLSAGTDRLTIVGISNNPKGFEIASKLWGGFLKRERGPTPIEIVRVDDRTTRIVMDGASGQGEVLGFALLMAVGHGIAL